MKIVNRATFLAMPEETLFAKYSPQVMEELCIKGPTIEGGRDFWYTALDTIDCNDSGDHTDKMSAAEKEGVSVPMDFNTLSRDGLFDEGQLFAVWERADVEALMLRLTECLFGAYSELLPKGEISNVASS